MHKYTLRLRGAVPLVAATCLVLGGCYMHAEPEPASYVETTAAPIGVDIYGSPRTIYAGRPVYFYRDRWYYQDVGRWYYYPQEPQSLYQYRRRGYVQQAPPAPRAPSYVPAPRPAPAPAPPAVRVQ